MRVVKFGGTSVFHLERVLEIVQTLCTEGLCVVVSAVKNTTTLLRERNIKAVRTLYIKWAKELGIRETIDLFWDHVQHLCHTAYTNDSQQQEDLLVSYGERFTAYVVDLAINRLICPSIFFDNIQVRGFFGDAEITHIDPHYPNPNTVLVVPGFYGYDHNRVVKTIGESGSDITAGAMARVLDAEEVIIYTDVLGIYTADPRIVKDATIIPEITQWDAIELGYAGGNVLHPRTISQLLDTNIVLWVRHIEEDAGGTKVHNTVRDPCLAVALTMDQILVTIEGQHMNGIPGIASELFDTLAMQGISVSFITQSCSECAISFAIAEKYIESLHTLTNITDIRKIGIVTLVGSNMKSSIGTAASFFSAIATAHINVLAIAQGSTERSISAAIQRQDAVSALQQIHQCI